MGNNGYRGDKGMKLYEILNGLVKGKKIKVADLSDKPEELELKASEEQMLELYKRDVAATITVNAGKIVDIKRDYRGTQYLKDMT